MKTYELTYIVSPESTLQEAGVLAKEIESFIQNKEGTILRQNNPIARTLSYPIKKHASGFAGSIEFSLEPENLQEVAEKVAKTGKIVRHMVIIKKPIKEQKQRKQRPAFTISAPESTPETSKEKDNKIIDPEKVELKDIEQKLEELLGE